MSAQTSFLRKSGMQAMSLVVGVLLSGSACAASIDEEPVDQSGSIDTQLVRESVISTVRLLNDVYIYPDTARRVGVEMIRRLDEGMYDGISTKQEFASRMGSELSELSKDGHMGVLVAEGSEPPTHVLTETVERFRLNYAFQRAEVLDGNIGYLKLNKFHPAEGARLTADHAFGFLASTDALIIDLTECKGGSPELVRHMLSNFFSEQTLLWSIVDRDGARTHDAHSEVGVGADRFKSDFPVFILTSANTASAAELFTYALKSYGKAKTVGQGTVGIAHFVGAQPINQHFVGRFSTYRNVNPVTNRDWEGVGIPPDVDAEPTNTLSVALRMATASIAIKRGASLDLD